MRACFHGGKATASQTLRPLFKTAGVEQWVMQGTAELEETFQGPSLETSYRWPPYFCLSNGRKAVCQGSCAKGLTLDPSGTLRLCES